MIDTGLWRNIGQRLWAVREHVEGEEMFLANYSDALSDVDLHEMIETFRQSGKAACFLAARPSFSLHLVNMEGTGALRAAYQRKSWSMDQRRLFHLPLREFLTTCGTEMNSSRRHFSG